MNHDTALNRMGFLPGGPAVTPQPPVTVAADAFAGINFATPGLKSRRLAAETGVPVYHDLNGPQLETDLVFTPGAQLTF